MTGSIVSVFNTMASQAGRSVFVDNIDELLKSSHNISKKSPRGSHAVSYDMDIFYLLAASCGELDPAEINLLKL